MYSFPNKFSCFFYDPVDVGSLSSAFSKSSLKSGRSQFTYCWSLTWRILSITLLVCEMSAIVWSFEHSLVLPFFGIGMNTDFFQFCGHCWVFQICWHIECSTLTTSSFQIWNNSLGIPLPAIHTQLLLSLVCRNESLKFQKNIIIT